MTKGIYCYLDTKQNEVVYIGKDSNIDKNKRHRDHLAPFRYNEQPINRILQNNPDRYIYQVLWEIDDCTDNHLNQMEIFYIKKYDPQFNFTEGGDGISGFKHSEETRKKISESRKGKTHSPETRKKISEANKGENHPMYGKTPWNKGKTLSDETRKKMSENHRDVSGTNNPMYGKTHSEEARKKLSEVNKGKNNPMYGKTPWNKGKTLSDETRKKMSEAKNTTGFYRVTKEKKKSVKQGFLWDYRYYDNNKRKSICSADLKKLEKKVKKEGLEWKVIDKENSIKSIRENNNHRFN